VRVPVEVSPEERNRGAGVKHPEIVMAIKTTNGIKYFMIRIENTE
jgi:hypothetical protein